MLLTLRRRARTALLCACPIVLGLLTGTADASYRVTQFQTPSHRILCGYVRGGGEHPLIRCDLLFLNDRAAFLTASGKAVIQRVTDAIADPRTAKVIPYGHSRRLGSFRCTSRTTGLTCVSLRSGHGFEVSRERRRMF
jgi:hypothetical protein